MATNMTFTDGITVIPADWLNYVNTVINSGGAGSVTTVSVATANGFAGTVANPTTTPVITVKTSITGLLKGNGTAISAAVSGTDFQPPIGTIVGLTKGNGANSLTAAVAGTDYVTDVSTNTFTNKTYDTAGTGNSFSIAGVAANANTGTGAVARATSPTFVTPTLGVATCTTLNGMTINTSTGTLGITNAKSFSVQNSITLAGTDSAVYTLPGATANIGYLEMPQNSQSVAYGLVLADSGKHILHPSADTTARTFTIPANASVAYPIGTAISFVNQASAGVLTIAITTDTMRLAGPGTTGSRTLAANGIATALKITATEWIISGTGLT